MGNCLPIDQDHVEFEKIFDEIPKEKPNQDLLEASDLQTLTLSSTKDGYESQENDSKDEKPSNVHSHTELLQTVKNLEERSRQRKLKNDERVAQLKTSKKKLKRRTERLKKELLETQQQLFESRNECDMAITEKEQLEKRLKETIYRFQSDYIEKAALLNAQIVSLKSQKDSSALEILRLHEIIKSLTEKRTFEERVISSVEQMKELLLSNSQPSEDGLQAKGDVAQPKEDNHVVEIDTDTGKLYWFVFFLGVIFHLGAFNIFSEKIALE